MPKVGAAIFGATGSLGQQFVRFLDRNPLLEVKLIGASKEKAGKCYSDFSSQWYADTEGTPSYIAEMRLSECSVSALKEAEGIDIVFSALPSGISKPLELECAKEGFMVISKANSYRMDPLVPLLVPEVNPDHLRILPIQRQAKNLKGSGAIISDPNCTTTGLVIALKPILDNVGLKNVVVTTMQAMSGAGYLGGLSPIAIMDNVLPFIEGEEPKLENETRKIVGRYANGMITNAEFQIFSSCTRVPVDNGHMEDVYFETERDCDSEDLKRFMKRFRGEPQELELPSAPQTPIVVREEIDRPQPKIDLNTNNGMSVIVGRVRRQGRGFRMMLLVHNTVRGGAGMAVLNAEYLVKKGIAESVYKATVST